MNEIRNKDIKNKALLRKLCYQLDLDFYNIVGFNPMFKFYGSMEENYSFHTNILYSKIINYNIDFRFTINYIGSDILTIEELHSNLSDEELEIILDKRRDINYIFIQYVAVRPHRQGIGTQLVKAFIKRIKAIDKIKIICLHPEGLEFEQFWTSIGFRRVNSNDIKNKNNFFPWYDSEMLYVMNER